MATLNTADQRYQFLISMGDFYPLKLRIDDHQYQSEIQSLQDQWRPYNKSKPSYRRNGLSLFSLDGSTSGEIDLNSIYEYNRKNNTTYHELSFKTPTPNWHALTSISKMFAPIESSLGRSHLIHLPEGGFFPPHRDLGESFRLIAFLNCDSDCLYFILDDKKISFTSHAVYFANTRKSHTLFSFAPDATILVINVDPTEEAFDFCIRNLEHK